MSRYDNPWGYFPITVQGAVAICGKEGLDFQAIHNQQRDKGVNEAFLLKTGAKITFCTRLQSYVIYGYSYDWGDTVMYRVYANKRKYKAQSTGSGGQEWVKV